MNSLPTPYYDRDGITIYHGDALDVLKYLPDESVDCVITDPPYSSGTRREASKGLRKSMNRGIEDGAWFTSDSLTTDGFIWLMRACAQEWKRVLKPGGHILCFIDWRMMPSLGGAIESADLRRVNLLVWDKTYFGMGAYFRNQHELILHFSKGKTLPPQRMDTGNVLSYKPIRGGIHPTEKPVDLISRLISTVCPVGGVVLDAFAGSGAALEAAVKEQRHAIGIELEEKYCEIAVRRLSQQVLPMEVAV